MLTFPMKVLTVTTNILVVFVLIVPLTCRQTHTSGNLLSSLSHPQVMTCSSLWLQTLPSALFLTHIPTICALADGPVPQTRFFLTK
jgi:hypothetical protein